MHDLNLHVSCLLYMVEMEKSMENEGHGDFYFGGYGAAESKGVSLRDFIII